MKNTYNSLKNKALWLVPVAGAALTSSAHAAGEPIDLSAAGTTIVGYLGTAAGAAVVVFIAIVGIRWMVRAFKSVK